MTKEQIESIKADICDDYCMWRFTLNHPDDLEEKCEKCRLNRLVADEEVICESNAG